jgi:hypothetical protein
MITIAMHIGVSSAQRILELRDYCQLTKYRAPSVFIVPIKSTFSLPSPHRRSKALPNGIQHTFAVVDCSI